MCKVYKYTEPALFRKLVPKIIETHTKPPARFVPVYDMGLASGLVVHDD